MLQDDDMTPRSASACRLSVDRWISISAFVVGAGTLVLCRDELRLKQSCVPDLDETWCIAGNLAGLCSTVLWFGVLTPQILHNFRRRSVEGLSFAWSVANFSASCINLFFILRLEMPTYVLISGFYMPFLEAIILLQFVIYGEQGRYQLPCIIVAATFSVYTACNLIFWHQLTQCAISVEWVAITLWSLETIPQLWVNHELGTTEGQAADSVMIAWLGKTTDFTGMYLLRMPSQNILKTFFSSFTAYCNVLQYFLLLFAKRPCPGAVGAAAVGSMMVACCALLAHKLSPWWGIVGPLFTGSAIFGGYACLQVGRRLYSRRRGSLRNPCREA